jgi:hypothetical protein
MVAGLRRHRRRRNHRKDPEYRIKPSPTPCFSYWRDIGGPQPPGQAKIIKKHAFGLGKPVFPFDKSQKPFDKPEKPFDICKISHAEPEASFAKPKISLANDETSFAEREGPFAKPA